MSPWPEVAGALDQSVARREQGVEKYTVDVSREGEMILVRIIEENVAEGCVGRGKDVPTALEDLADQLRKRTPDRRVPRAESGSDTKKRSRAN